MKKGINRGCVPATMAAADVFALAKQVGFDGIELNLEEADPNAARPESPRGERSRRRPWRAAGAS